MKRLTLDLLGFFKPFILISALFDEKWLILWILNFIFFKIIQYNISTKIVNIYMIGLSVGLGYWLTFVGKYFLL